MNDVGGMASERDEQDDLKAYDGKGKFFEFG